jgi:uncharacterized protein (DUF1015 family)
MAIIRPFRGIRYNPAIAGDLSQLVSPPYDVISPEQQTELHLRSPYNAIHLDLNQDTDRYGAAAQRFRDWLQQAVIVPETEPALYFYAQEFTLKDGIKRRRLGVFAALKLEEFSSGVVRPHERTFEGAKKDRLALLRACRAHLSSVFCVFGKRGWSLEESARPALTAPPLASFTDENDVTHTLWRTTDNALIAAISEGLAPESLIIADGHHRYETALKYRQERSAEGRTSSDEPYDYVLAFLTNAYDDGLVILPTHRLLREGPMASPQNLRAVLQRDFRIASFALNNPAAFLGALRAPGPTRRIGCAVAGASHYWLLSFDDRVTGGLQLSMPLRALDVTVLHEVILTRFFGLPTELQKQVLSYTIDEEEALRGVAAHRTQAAFLLNATPFEQVVAVCEQGETMSQKSTYFYPKLLTGLVFYQL